MTYQNEWEVALVSVLGVILIAMVFGIPLVYITEKELSATQAHLKGIRAQEASVLLQKPTSLYKHKAGFRVRRMEADNNNMSK